jgi:hypothetical protein
MILQNSGAACRENAEVCRTTLVMAGLVPAIHVLLYDRIEKVVPIRIRCNDRSDFPSSWPMFDVVLALNGIADIVEPFKVNECFQPVLLSEAVDKPGTMLEHATNEVVGYTDIKNAVATVRQNVNPTTCHVEMLLRRGWPGQARP